MPVPHYYLACLAAVLMNGQGGLQAPLCIFHQKSGRFPPMYSSSQLRSPHWYQYMAPLWLIIGSLSLGGNQEAFDGPAIFEVGLNAISTTDLFDAFIKTLCVGNDNVTLGFSLLASLWMTNVSSTNLCQSLGGVEQCLELFVLSTPLRGWLQWG